MDYENTYRPDYARQGIKRACSITDPDSIVSNLPGPGRAVDNATVFLGRGVELLLSKAAIKLGRGPTEPINDPGQPEEIRPTDISRFNGAYSTQFAQPEAAHACSITNPDSTASNLTGPGRAVDNFYLYAGRHLELLLGRVAMKMGKGPLVTAKRIMQHRAEMMSMTMSHADNCYCQCHDCDFQRRFGGSGDKTVVRSPNKLRKIYAGINKDSRRLVNYVKSEQYTTQTQALESVLDLSACDGELRAILTASGASKAVSDVVHTYETFHISDHNVQEVHLNTSRKALVSLDDAELNTLLKEFELVTRSNDRAYSIWDQIVPYLWSPHHAFLVVRMVRRSTYWLDHKKGIPGPLIAIKDSPGYFEWKECEEFVSFGLWMDVLQYSLSDVSDWLFKNIDKMPRVLEAEYLKMLSKVVFQLNGSQFIRFHSVCRAVAQGLRRSNDDMSLTTLRNKYTHEPLLPLLTNITCPVTSAAGEIILRRNYRSFPDAEERRLYDELVCYIDASEHALRTRAWNYIEHFLAHDAYRCKLMLDTLSRTAFGTSASFSSFAEERKKSCVPNKDKDDEHGLYLRPDDDHRIYFRHRNSENIAHYHDRFGCNCLVAKRSHMEMLRVYDGWTFDVMVGRGEQFSSSAYYPFPAEADEDGTTSYLVMILVAPFRCRDAQWALQTPIHSVKDGTKPEDLRIEVECAHQKSLLIPTYFMVPVLRYSPEACAEVMGVVATNLFKTGPYSWNPRKPGQDIQDPDEYQSRIFTIQEAIESGYSCEQIQYETDVDEPRCDDEDWPNSES